MSSHSAIAILVALCLCGVGAARASGNGKSLCLVPFPKQVDMEAGRFQLKSAVRIEASSAPGVRRVVDELREDLSRATGAAVSFDIVPHGEQTPWILSVSATGKQQHAPGAAPAQSEGYRLVVAKGGVTLTARDEAGLGWGIQTLRQLVRSNVSDGSIPCVTITDYPSMKWRGFQDDITRGQSSKLSLLKSEIDLGSMFKMNFWTYYMEHQFAFTKHPEIGPKDGSLTSTELKELVISARDYGVDVIGCQQSFGHFYNILKYDQYKGLRETEHVLNPTNEDSYKLLDDLYSEQAPLTDSKLFNVCCDETWGLGEGPSKTLAAKIGVGGVYAGHLKRIHDMLRDKYGKRMMMWGDIISQHPENLGDIPKDTIMLSWDYGASPSFEGAVIPFEKSGYDFFVCPGVSCWNRILPDFDTAVVNIRNYVRDGLKHGASGMLNTTWDDDGENLFAANWHGLAWGAECAWNGSTTDINDFNRRLGAVLIGEKNGNFDKAIGMLSRLPELPGYDRMFDARFWKVDFGPAPTGPSWTDEKAMAMLAIVDPALQYLRAAKRDAKFNSDLLDYHIFVAERARLMASREIDFAIAARAYDSALKAGNDTDKSAADVQRAIALLTGIRDRHVELRDRFSALWLGENKPYALDRVTARYDTLIDQYNSVIKRLQEAVGSAKSGKSLPGGKGVGLAVFEAPSRELRPPTIVRQTLLEKTEWADTGYRRRVGIEVAADDSARRDQPVEVQLPMGIGTSGVRLYEVGVANGAQTPVLSQLQGSKKSSHLIFMARGDLAAGSKRSYMLYFDPDTRNPTPDTLPGVIVAQEKNGAWVENEQVKLLFGTEGAHIYRWEVKRLNGLDMTVAGDTDWAGFADISGQHRNAVNKMQILESGPVRARLKFTDDYGVEKTFTAYAGVPWVDVTLRQPTTWFWLYDDAAIMGASSTTPGKYAFSNGSVGNMTADQAQGNDVNWSCKYRPDGLLLGMITPETKVRHTVGPGGGMGGVGIEFMGEADHFVIYGGLATGNVREAMDTLWVTLDQTERPEVSLYAAQMR